MADLSTAISNLIARIVQVTESPNEDITIAGRTIARGTYLTQLGKELELMLNLQAKTNLEAYAQWTPYQ